jgi:hypothetical protein
MTTTEHSSSPEDRAKRPSDGHRRLEVFIGKWINEGELLATEDAPATRILTSDVYEWMPGKFFVLHTAYGRIGDLDAGGTEIIGYDETSDTYNTYFFDSAGNVTTEQLTVSDGVWTWQGQTTRATSVFSDDGKTQTCRHERSDDGVNWVPAMQITLSKVE